MLPLFQEHVHPPAGAMVHLKKFENAFGADSCKCQMRYQHCNGPHSSGGRGVRHFSVYKLFTFVRPPYLGTVDWKWEIDDLVFSLPTPIAPTCAIAGICQFICHLTASALFAYCCSAAHSTHRWSLARFCASSFSRCCDNSHTALGAWSEPFGAFLWVPFFHLHNTKLLDFIWYPLIHSEVEISAM